MADSCTAQLRFRLPTGQLAGFICRHPAHDVGEHEQIGKAEDDNVFVISWNTLAEIAGGDENA